MDFKQILNVSIQLDALNRGNFLSSFYEGIQLNSGQ